MIENSLNLTFFSYILSSHLFLNQAKKRKEKSAIINVNSVNSQKEDNFALNLAIKKYIKNFHYNLNYENSTEKN